MSEAAVATVPEWLETMSVLRVQEGDVLVFRYPRALTASAHANIMASLELLKTKIRERSGVEVSVLVLEEDADLGVLRPSGGGV